MKRQFAQIFFWFFAICIAITLIDCVIVDYVSSENTFNSSRECPELPNHFEDTHLSHFEDISCSDPEIQSYKLNNCSEIAGMLSIDLNSNFLTFIWQPPKCV